MTTSYDVARQFLRELGAPQTDGMVRAVAIWLRFESGTVIRGNNPWNLHSGPACSATQGYCPGQGTLPGQIGNRYAGSGDRNVAVFATLQDGVRAAARNLVNLAPSYGYGTVISEARQGDALGFLRALQNSSWSAGHYGYAKLVNAFQGTFSYNSTLTFTNYGGERGNVIPSGDGEPLSFWKGVNGGPGITFPRGHIVTNADVDTIIAYLHQWNIIADDWTGLAGIGIRSLLTAFVGRRWDEQLALDIQAGLRMGADEVADALNPVDEVLDPVADFFATLGNVFGEIPMILLFGFGAFIAFYGFNQLTGAGLPGKKQPVETISESKVIEPGHRTITRTRTA